VRNVEDFGAFIDIGAERDGFVHVKDMSTEFVYHASDMLRPGQPVRAWVKYVDADLSKLGLALVRAPRALARPAPPAAHAALAPQRQRPYGGRRSRSTPPSAPGRRRRTATGGGCRLSASRYWHLRPNAEASLEKALDAHALLRRFWGMWLLSANASSSLDSFLRLPIADCRLSIAPR